MMPQIRELIARLHKPGETDWRDYESELLQRRPRPAAGGAENRLS